MTHICVSKLTIIGSDNGLSPGRRQAIIWTNAGIMLTGPLGTNFSEILIKIYTFSLKKMHLKMSWKWRPSYLGLNVLIIAYNHKIWKLRGSKSEFDFFVIALRYPGLNELRDTWCTCRGGIWVPKREIYWIIHHRHDFNISNPNA